MFKFLFPTFLLTISSVAQEINWAQPPVECLEESVPRPTRKRCLDLSQVANASFDFPADMSEDEKLLWTTTYAKDLRICRAQELVRRGNANPGSINPYVYQYAWMRILATQDSLAKRKAVNRASAQFKIPQSLLVGALLQESYVANLGIVNDGGNYSCGLGQLNPVEWCEWMESLPQKEQRQAGWPVDLMNTWKKNHAPKQSFCKAPHMKLTLMEAFYKRALGQLEGLPEYRLEKKHFQGFNPADIVAEFPTADSETQALRYATLKAFIDNCNSIDFAIRGKARTIAQLFKLYVPQALQESQKYKKGETYNRDCLYTWKSPYYPAHPGWLLAIATYNLGPRTTELIKHYEQWNNDEYQMSEEWKDSTPQDLIEKLYWSGKYNPETDLIDYASPTGIARTIPWYRQCITQRHVSNTVNGIALQGFKLAETLGDASCPRSVFDADGKLVETKVPEARRYSSGTRN